MSQTSISEIREQYNKKNKLNRYSIILIVIFFILGLFLILINYEHYLNIIFFVIFSVMFVFIIFSPKISEYNLIRYHLAELITFLEDANFKKSEANIDNLAFYLNELYYGIDDSFLFLSIKSNIGGLWDLLKYKIYPNLKANDYNTYIPLLKEINNSFDIENLTNLNQTISGFINDVAEYDNQNAILFPYEKPNFLNQIYKSGKNKFLHFFRINFVFRFVCVASVVFIIGYFCSIKISSLNFDSTFIGALSIVSLGIAKEI